MAVIDVTPLSSDQVINSDTARLQARRVCGLRIFTAKNSRKRSEARSPAAAMNAGTTCVRMSPMISARSMMNGQLLTH